MDAKSLLLPLLFLFQVMPAVGLPTVEPLSSFQTSINTGPLHQPPSAVMPPSLHAPGFNMTFDEGKHGKRSLRNAFQNIWLFADSWTIEICPNGTVRGTRSIHPEFGLIQLIVIDILSNFTGRGLENFSGHSVRYDEASRPDRRMYIKGNKTGLLLCMNKHRKVYAATEAEDEGRGECIFKQKRLPNHYDVFYSDKYNTTIKNNTRHWYIGIKTDKKTEYGKIVTRRSYKREFMQFMEDNADDNTSVEFPPGVVPVPTRSTPVKPEKETDNLFNTDRQRKTGKGDRKQSNDLTTAGRGRGNKGSRCNSNLLGGCQKRNKKDRSRKKHAQRHGKNKKRRGRGRSRKNRNGRGRSRTKNRDSKSQQGKVNLLEIPKIT